MKFINTIYKDHIKKLLYEEQCIEIPAMSRAFATLSAGYRSEWWRSESTDVPRPDRPLLGAMGLSDGSALKTDPPGPATRQSCTAPRSMGSGCEPLTMPDGDRVRICTRHAGPANLSVAFRVLPCHVHHEACCPGQCTVIASPQNAGCRLRKAGSGRQVSEQKYWVRHQVGRVGEVGWARCVWQDAADITQW